MSPDTGTPYVDREVQEDAFLLPLNKRLSEISTETNRSPPHSVKAIHPT
jgi:hypothetical protein